MFLAITLIPILLGVPGDASTDMADQPATIATRPVPAPPPPSAPITTTPCPCRCEPSDEADQSSDEAALSEPTLEILTYDAPCIQATRGLRFGLIDEEYPAVPVWDHWTPVMGDNIPLSDAQLAWLAGDERLARTISREMEARGNKVFLGLLGAGAGMATGMMGWTLFGAGKVDPQVSLPIGLGGMVIAAVAVLYTTFALQEPLEPFMTPTPSHRMTRQEAYDLILRLNARYDRVLCETD